MVLGTCQESSPALRQQAIEASPLLLENEKSPAGHCRFAFLHVETRIVDEGVCQSRHWTAVQKSADPGQTGRFQPLR